MQGNSRVMKQPLINNGKVVENQENDGFLWGLLREVHQLVLTLNHSIRELNLTNLCLDMIKQCI